MGAGEKDWAFNHLLLLEAFVSCFSQNEVECLLIAGACLTEGVVALPQLMVEENWHLLHRLCIPEQGEELLQAWLVRRMSSSKYRERVGESQGGCCSCSFQRQALL
jgi:hypothetical protein